MNYTTLDRVKLALDAEEDTDDTLIEDIIIPSVSRAIDRHCAGRVGVDDYFALGDVVNEKSRCIISNDGVMYIWVQKPVVNTLLSINYRPTPQSEYTALDIDYAEIDGYGIRVPLEGYANKRVAIKVSYNGGFADTVENLPADILEVADILAVRFYKERKSGMNDTIGIAELGTLSYTKALPVRVVEMLKPYKRIFV